MDQQLFDAVAFHTEKVSGVAVTATTGASPQTIVTMTTPSLPAGTYNLAYSFAVTFLDNNRPLHFGIGGTYADSDFYSVSSNVNNVTTHMNRLYGYPKDHTGGAITISLVAYDPLAEAVIDFADVIVSRVA